MYIYIISFSEELKPIFAYSTAPLICKIKKLQLCCSKRENVLKRHRPIKAKVSIQCTSSQRTLILMNLLTQHL